MKRRTSNMIKSVVKIEIIDPNTSKQLEEALSNMIAYQLASKKIDEIKENT